MKPELRRQVTLVGLLVLAVLGYLRFGMGGGEAGDTVVASADLPAIDVAGLMGALKDVATIGPSLPPGRLDSEADRNLFQYTARKAPPPTREELEALQVQRKAVEAQLAIQEQQLREQKERERLAGEQREQAESLARQNPPVDQHPQPLQAPVASASRPAINLRLMGMMGPPDRRLAVFQDGEKVLMARQGDVLLGQFKVLSIGVEGAEIGYVDPSFGLGKRLGLGQ